MRPERLLKLAADLSRQRKDGRVFCLGAVGWRSDGAIVSAVNGSPPEPEPKHHCEARLARKLDKGATVFLARTLASGEWAMSSPCSSCRRVLRHCRRVFFTIGPDEWGCWTP